MKEILFVNESYRAWISCSNLLTFNSEEVKLTVQYWNGQFWTKVERFNVLPALQHDTFARIADCYNA